MTASVLAEDRKRSHITSVTSAGPNQGAEYAAPSRAAVPTRE